MENKNKFANNCRICNGVYAANPVFVDNGEDKPMTLLCYRSVCLKCGDVKAPALGVYRLKGDIPDFGARYWKEFSRIDIAAFTALVMNEPRRTIFFWDEIPMREIVGHRAEFYEPAAASALF